MEKYDIVQITDIENEWFTALLIVDEVKSWGIQGYIFVPRSGRAFYRIENGKFEKVGTSLFAEVDPESS
jgi:hypothetical protein